MFWKKIPKNEIASWNIKLQNSNASFFQYPYYTEGYKDFFFGKPINLQLLDETNNSKGFCSILQIHFLFFKIGLIIRGPVIFSDNILESIESLKRYVKKEGFIFLRINANDFSIEKVLKNDPDFKNENYFTIYNGSQNCDFNVYQMPEEQLLRSFRTDCRNKIRFASEINFRFSVIQSDKELKSIYNSFTELGKSKGFKYRSYKSYKTIFNEGSKYNLCSVYRATFQDENISSIFMVKDAQSFNCLSGAMILKKGLRPKHSPANKLHYLAIQDCFYKEKKPQYNLSYSAPGSGVYMFKDSFHPAVAEKPGYYTYVIKKNSADFILAMQKKYVKKIKLFFRSLTGFIK